MGEEDYQPGQRVSYSEEHGNWEAEVMKNNCSPEIIDYQLKVIRELSPPLRGFKSLKPGEIIHFQKPIGLGFRGSGSIDGLVSELGS